MKQKFALFGDVHGEITPLRKALNYGIDRAEKVVGLGDYVNRGTDTAGVLDLLVELVNQRGPSTILLRGNHEVELLRFLDTGDISRFAAFGGLETIGSYVRPVIGNVVEEFQAAFPATHRELLESMPAFLETEDYLFSHVGFDPQRPAARDEESMVLGSFHELFSFAGVWPRPLVVSGHYPQRNSLPYVGPHFISMDSGCGTFTDGRLTVLLLPSREITQFGLER